MNGSEVVNLKPQGFGHKLEKVLEAELFLWFLKTSSFSVVTTTAVKPNEPINYCKTLLWFEGGRLSQVGQCRHTLYPRKSSIKRLGLMCVCVCGGGKTTPAGWKQDAEQRPQATSSPSALLPGYNIHYTHCDKRSLIRKMLTGVSLDDCLNGEDSLWCKNVTSAKGSVKILFVMAAQLMYGTELRWTVTPITALYTLL